ncbi:hypothetical protein M501DRAFT_1019880 [Patellaria atrata CBS 101060]|uniref:Uncharacterized protein n=1 Tax=Patellaria atrata CBS 101060 TaxID=1346257 RepID=A0A9P4S390_9PEZI|nr:hypothetical protein M501DRAFT_1019880 [Patellaria atrata CBS 101060]
MNPFLILFLGLLGAAVVTIMGFVIHKHVLAGPGGNDEAATNFLDRTPEQDRYMHAVRQANLRYLYSIARIHLPPKGKAMRKERVHEREVATSEETSSMGFGV